MKAAFLPDRGVIKVSGEDAVAKFVEGLPGRVRNGEFSLSLAKQ